MPLKRISLEDYGKEGKRVERELFRKLYAAYRSADTREERQRIDNLINDYANNGYPEELFYIRRHEVPPTINGFLSHLLDGSPEWDISLRDNEIKSITEKEANQRKAFANFKDPKHPLGVITLSYIPAGIIAGGTAVGISKLPTWTATKQTASKYFSHPKLWGKVGYGLLKNKGAEAFKNIAVATAVAIPTELLSDAITDRSFEGNFHYYTGAPEFIGGFLNPASLVTFNQFKGMVKGISAELAFRRDFLRRKNNRNRWNTLLRHLKEKVDSLPEGYVKEKLGEKRLFVEKAEPLRLSSITEESLISPEKLKPYLPWYVKDIITFNGKPVVRDNISLKLPIFGSSLDKSVPQGLYTLAGKPLNLPTEAVLLTLSNIKFISKYFPEAKAFGSSVLFKTDNPHIPSDVDVYITRASLDKAMKDPRINSRISLNTPDPNDRVLFWAGEFPSTNFSHGDPRAVDLNIISVNPEGVGNARALQLYRQWFPDAYQLQLKLILDNPRLNLLIKDINGNIITEQLLLDAYDPTVGSILDILEINKLPKMGRKLELLTVPSLAGDADKALKLYAKMTYGSSGRVLPRLNFSHENPLKRIYNGKIDSITDPLILLNLANYWYLLREGGLFRSVNTLGILDDPWAGNLASTMRNLTTWSRGLNGGGNAMGFGLNTTSGTTSNWYGAVNGWILPRTLLGFYDGMPALDAIDLVMRRMGSKLLSFSSTEQKKMLDILRSHGIKANTSDLTDTSTALRQLPSKGHAIAKGMEDIGKNLGIYAFEGSNFGSSTYRGVIQPLSKSNTAIGISFRDYHNGVLPYSGPNGFDSEVNAFKLQQYNNILPEINNARERLHRNKLILSLERIPLYTPQLYQDIYFPRRFGK